MKARFVKLFSWCLFVSLAVPELASAAAAKVANIVIVADTRKFSGWEAWWTNLYNESHLYFTLLTIVLIPTIGVLFGLFADFLMSFIGIDLKSRDLADH